MRARARPGSGGDYIATTLSTTQSSAQHVCRFTRSPPRQSSIVRPKHIIGTQELMYSKVNLAVTLAPIVSDIVALVAIWLKTYHHVRQHAAIGWHSGLGVMLIQYGTLYFIALLAVYILPFVAFLIPSAATLTDAVNAFVNILPNIMISRFLINLRQVDSPVPSNASESSSSNFSTLNFHVPSQPRIIGNLGEPLVFIDADHDDKEGSGDAASWATRLNESHDNGENEGTSSTYTTGDGSSRRLEVRITKRLKNRD
ncbi:hypothetical protein NM688_g2982 [Phlebia brevispora]|uniref:Uncharacterized protein n=1 Tax=Phlebia brevispora TaxID=194682 RepID=A0ACC1T792_9APHY|nr:hypothetical protein NM688_g2982 [Phlebia brevispora]